MTTAQRAAVTAAGGLLLALTVIAPASAQTGAAPPSARVTASIGVGLVGGYPVGAVDGNLRRNVPGTPASFTLLRTESEIERASSFEARVALALSRGFEIEVGGVYATPQLTVGISGDNEFGESTMATDELAQYGVEVSGIYLIPRATGARLRPYALGGGGYLRQLHEGRLRLETGRTIHVGGGVRYVLRAGGPGRPSLGARAEGRYVRRSGGVDFAGTSRGFSALSLLAFVGF